MVELLKCTNKKGKKLGLITIYIFHTLKKKPKSGYEILSEIRQKCGNEWSPSKGTIYPLLKQLEQEQLIRIKNVGPRSKNIFELSPKGRRLLFHVQGKERIKREVFIFPELN